MTSALLRKSFGVRGEVHRITPESAGRRRVGFSPHRLDAGDGVAERTGDREAILVMTENDGIAFGSANAATWR